MSTHLKLITGIQQTILVVKPAAQTLPADILVGNDTEHDSVYPVLPGQTIDFTGTIEASTVKAQMRGIESQFPNTTDYAGIKLSDRSSSFTATFTIPDGMTLPENLNKDSVRTDGFSGRVMPSGMVNVAVKEEDISESLMPA